MRTKCFTRTISLAVLLTSTCLYLISPAVADALHDASAAGNLDRVKQLIAGGTEVNAKDSGRLTPLDYATLMNHRHVAEVLIAAGANINVKDEAYGFTPLHMAVKLGHEILAELLIAKGADVEARAGDGATPLHWAALTGLKPIAELLIAKGANVNVKDKHGATPLQWAKAHADIMDLLKQHGAK